jgi:hypothetical protein
MSKVASIKSEQELFDLKQQEWINHGNLVVMAHQIEKLGNNERTIIELIGLRLYGK